MMDAFKDMYDVVVDRRANPQEGSYTCYLFDKGIDKILKKCGEECTEMVIAAKNSDKDELANEINDLLYHMIVQPSVPCPVSYFHRLSSGVLKEVLLNSSCQTNLYPSGTCISGSTGSSGFAS